MMNRTQLTPWLVWLGLALAVPVAAQDPGYITKDLTSATCTSNASTGCVVLQVPREGSIGVQIAGTFVGTVAFEGSIDGINYRPLGLTPSNGGSQDTTTTGVGVWVGSAGGLRTVRARVSAYTSGTVNAALQSAPSGGGAGGGSTSGTIELVDGDNDPLTDDPNDALKVSIVAGAASGTTDTDDGSVAAGQATIGLSLGLPMLYSGAAWVRTPGDATNGMTVNLGTNNDVTVTSGTVTANLSATDNAVLDDIADGIAVTNAGTFPTQVDGAALTALQLIDDIVSGSGVNVSQINGVAPTMGNGASGTGVQRVTIANDSTGVIALTGAGLTALQLIDNSIFADDAAFTLASSSVTMAGAIRDDALSTLTAVEGDAVPLRVSATGALFVTGSAGVTEFAEDTAHTTGAAGNLALAVRSNAGSALAGDGDYIPLMVNASGALYVTGGGGGTEYVTNAVAPTDPTGTANLMERDDALSTVTEIEGDWTNGRANARGALWVELDPTNAIAVTVSSGTITVGTFPDNEPFNVAQWGGNTATAGAGAVAAGTPRVTHASDDPAVTALQLIDNAVSGSGFNVSQINGVAPTMGNGASGTGVQRVTLASDSTGQVALATGSATIGALTANQTVNVAQINGVTPLMGAGNTGTGSARVTLSTDQAALVGLGIYVEDIGETISGNLAMSGTVRRDTAASSAGASGDNSTLNTDSLGRLWITGAAVEDAAETAAGLLVMQGTVRRDTAASSAGVTGDNATLNTDAVGALWVNPFSQTPAATTYLTMRISDGTNYLTASQDQTHDAAITTNTGPLVMGYASAAAPTNVSAGGDAVAEWHLLNGALVSNLAAGGTLITSTGASLNMNCTGGCSGGTQFAEDIAHITADAVTMAGTVRQDTKGTGIGANGDIANLYVNASGELYTAPAGQVAHDAVGTSVNPLLIGGYASQAAPSDVTGDGDATRIWTLRNGSPVANIAAGGTLITATSSSLNTTVTAGTITTVSTVTNLSQLGGAAVPMTTTQSDNLADTLDGLNTTGFTYIYDGANWDRWTGAITGTVTANAGTNLNTSALLTTTAHDAAFGTAGTADAQVLTVQGIASMTPILSTVTNAGTFAVQCSNCSGSGASAVDNSAYTVTVDSVAPAGLLYDATPQAVTDGNVALARMSTNRVAYATLRDAAGNERGANINASNQLSVSVDNTVTVASHAVTNAGTFVAQVDGAALTALQLIDNAQTGDTVHYRTSAGSTEDEHEVKATAGVLYSVAVTNTAATVSYLKCSNLTAANTTPGTSTVFLGLAIPGATTGAGFTHTFGPNGAAFGTALTCYLVKGAADTDVAEVGANEVKAVYTFK